ncbi:anaerobic ribonucleoside-triphosphate reductase activating protein [Desulfobotulus mexicanus]|uniref:Anaerobic ribonucleoside-triphosphate reductase activating protein n=1 Tax=Desulfobotulus mexicanus TaxID=2586642 RepID=A0A5S5MFR5_9BACT|nr:anaerobic ribonucleoside-triphosphate reductase activating protein [Desulfobotulus mexicanus]TYT74540.1 anaerobic ribonucleoside-triphosphate reductase activating protein [Desulfobotulus mexicanus]
MIFGGLQKNSLIDFPGKIAALVFTQGCNFHCPYCHNLGLIPMKGKDIFHEEDILLFLEKRRGLLEGLAITGGEPTLQKDLANFCEKVKKLGYPVKLDTNGSRPEVLKEVISAKLVDYIAMDIKTHPLEYSPGLCTAPMEQVLESSIRLILESGIDHEFRTTCVYPFITEEKIRRIIPIIKGARTYALQTFSSQSLYKPDFFTQGGRGLTPEETEIIQKLLAPHVGQCVIR